MRVFLSLSFFSSLRYTGLGVGLDLVRCWTCQAVVIGDGTVVGNEVMGGIYSGVSSNGNYNIIRPSVSETTMNAGVSDSSCGLSASQCHIAT